ncbi:MAG: hypothetical protein WC972_14075 [Trueperaceae bacterium]
MNNYDMRARPLFGPTVEDEMRAAAERMNAAAASLEAATEVLVGERAQLQSEREETKRQADALEAATAALLRRSDLPEGKGAA